MCAVKVSPKRIIIDERPKRRHGWKFYLGVLIVLLSLGGATAVKYDMPWTRPITKSVSESPVYLAVHEATRPAARVASGDIDYMQRWVLRQRTTQLFMLCSAGIAIGLFYIMWK